MNWFSSDYHFNHKNIIQFCNRPFKTIREMNRTIIENHNSKVGKNDTVFFLGDFCFDTSRIEFEMLIERMNGRFVFIRGNHDRNNKLKSAIYSVELKTEGKKIQLVHKPQDITEGYDLYLVGHVHEKWKFRKVYNTYMINVGVDVWDFYPVHMKQILKALKKWRKEDEILGN